MPHLDDLWNLLLAAWLGRDRVTPAAAGRFTTQLSEYVEVLRKGYASRWDDFMPSTGKRTGAYSTSVYDAQPFQLLNYNGAWDDVSTLAHESGQSMHSFLVDRVQPYATHDYPIFVAEVASTLNEDLLVNTMLEKAKSDDERLFLLGSHLDSLRATLFRQGLFAEFELRIHEMAARSKGHSPRTPFQRWRSAGSSWTSGLPHLMRNSSGISWSGRNATT